MSTGVEETKSDPPPTRFVPRMRAPTSGGTTLQNERLLPGLTDAIKRSGKHGEEGDAKAMVDVRSFLDQEADPFHTMPKGANALKMEASAAMSAMLKGYLNALEVIFEVCGEEGRMTSADVTELSGMFEAAEAAPKSYRYKKLDGAANRIRELLEAAADRVSRAKAPPTGGAGAGSSGGAATTADPHAGSSSGDVATDDGPPPPTGATARDEPTRPVDKFVWAAAKGKVASMCDTWRDNAARLTPEATDASGRSALVAAVFTGHMECVEFLLDGWDERKVTMPPANIDAPASPDGTSPAEPALFVSLRIKDDDMLRTLLGFGAALDFETATGETIKAEDVATEDWQQYWLAAARRLPKYNMERLRKANLHRVGLINYCLIGQWAAKALVLEALVTSVTLFEARKKKPLVILMPGPPGHGKTELAKCVKRVLGVNTGYDVWSISTLKEETDLFGAGPMFRGSAPTFLKFAKEYDGKRAVVVLDELDKASPGLLQALYAPFQDGVITARNMGTKKGESGNAETLDCSRTVYLATCNWGQSVVTDFIKEHEDDEEMLLCSTTKAINTLNVTLGFAIRQHIIERLTPAACDALVGRMDVVAPYIPFGKEEQWLLADTMIRSALKLLQKPPDSNRHVGSVVVSSSKTITDYLMKSFDAREGARSIFNTYTTKVLTAINAAYMTVTEPALLPGTTAELLLERPEGAGESFVVCNVTGSQ